MTALLRLRLSILRRRYGSPLELVVLAGLCWVAWVAGSAAAERGLPPAWASRGLSAGWLALAGALSLIQRRQLYTARELDLLLPSGVSARQLVALRGVEGALLALAGTALPVACAAGYARAQGLSLGPAIAGWWLLSAPLLAALSLLGAWALAGGLGARAAGVLAAAGVAALALLGPGPGPALGSALRGELLGLGTTGGAAALLAALALLVVPRGAAERRARGRRVRGQASPLLWRLAALPSRLLPASVGALVRRDLVVLARGGFPRGRLIACLLPAALLLLPVAGSDESLEGWQLSLLTLMFVGVLGTAAGFLFGVDLPRAREGWRLLERVQPLSGGAVLLSRWALAATYAMGLTAVAVAWVAQAEGAPPWPRVAAGAALLTLATTFDAVAFGLRCEARGSLVEATAYPLRGGVVAVGFALAAQIHPLLVGLYPLLGFAAEARRSAALWLRAECTSDHQAAA
ncbi:MAG: hypothetical protein R3F62_18440 [Planctomycetota bacterium]